MSKLLKYLVFPCMGAIFFLSCLSEGETLCESYIRFEYDYNTAYVDLFYKQASRVDLFLFNESDVFEKTVSVTSSGATFDKDYLLQLPAGIAKGTKFIAWSGLYPESYMQSTMTAGTSTMSDLIVALNAAAGAESDKSLHPLWFGKLNGGLIRYENEVNTINMVKDTKNVRIVIEAQNKDFEIDADDFTFSLTAKNNSYNHLNAVADNVARVYVPFVQENHGSSKRVVAEISTLRLLESNDNRLVITIEGQDDPIIDVNLNEYIDALKPAKHSALNLQEYMDREDEFGFVVLLTKTETPETVHYLSTMISINEWIPREQEE